jgi:hypothetical protein
MASLACKDCGKVLYSGTGQFPSDLSGENATPRKPCPDCGSTVRSYGINVFENLAASATRKIQRAWSNNQLTVLLFLLSVTLCVGLGAGLAAESLLLGVAYGLGVLIVFAVLLWMLLRGPLARVATRVVRGISGF